MDRRAFLQMGGAVAGVAASAWGAGRSVAIDIPASSAGPVKWAAGELRAALAAAGVGEGPGFTVHVEAAGAGEGFALTPVAGGIRVSGGGLVYGLLELAQRAGREGFGVSD